MSRTINIPGLPVSTVQELLSTLAGNPNAFSDTSNITRWEWYDTIGYPIAGITSPLQFFVPRTGNEFQTNWPSNGLGNNEVFVLQSIRFQLLPGVRLDSNNNPIAEAQAQTFGASQASSALDTRFAALEAFRVAVQNTKVFVRLGDLTLAEVMGLDSFPSGRGLDVSAALAGTFTASNERGVAYVGNGLPVRSNGWAITPNRAVLPSDRFLVELRQGAALSVGASNPAFAIRAIAEGVYIRPIGK